MHKHSTGIRLLNILIVAVCLTVAMVSLTAWAEETEHNHVWEYRVNDHGDQLIRCCSDTACEKVEVLARLIAGELVEKEIPQGDDETLTYLVRTYDGTEGLSEDIPEGITRKRKLASGEWQDTDDVSQVGTYRISAEVNASEAGRFTLETEYQIIPRELTVSGIPDVEKHYDGSKEVSLNKKDDGKIIYKLDGIAEKDDNLTAEELTLNISAELPEAEVKLDADGNIADYNVTLHYMLDGDKKENYVLSEESQSIVKVKVLPPLDYEHHWTFDVNDNGDEVLALCSDADCILGWETPKRIAQLTVGGLDNTEDASKAVPTRVYDGTEAVEVQLETERLKWMGVELDLPDKIEKERKLADRYTATSEVSDVGIYRVTAQISALGKSLAKEYEVVPSVLTVNGIEAIDKFKDGTTEVFLKKTENGKLDCQITGIAKADENASEDTLSVSATAVLPGVEVNIDEEGHVIPYTVPLTYSLTGSKKDNYILSDQSQKNVEVMVFPEANHTWEYTLNESRDKLLAHCTDAECGLGWDEPKCIARLTVDGLEDPADPANGLPVRTYNGEEGIQAILESENIAQMGKNVSFAETEDSGIIQKEVLQESAYSSAEEGVSNVGTYRISSKVKISGEKTEYTLVKEYQVVCKELTIEGITVKNKTYDKSTSVSFDKNEKGNVKCIVTGLVDSDKGLTKEELSVSFTAKLPNENVKTDSEGYEIPYNVELHYSINGSKAGNYVLSDKTQQAVDVTVLRTDIENAEVTLSDAFITNGEKQTRKVEKVTLIVGGKKLVLTEGTDFTVSENEQTEAGAYTMALTGIGNFKGTRAVEYRVLPELGDTEKNEIKYGDGTAKLEVSDANKLGVELNTTLKDLLMQLPGNQLEQIYLGENVTWTLTAENADSMQKTTLAQTVSTTLKPGQYVKLTLSASAEQTSFSCGFDLSVNLEIPSGVKDPGSGKRREFSVLMPATATSSKTVASTTSEDASEVTFSINTTVNNGSWYILAYKDAAVVTTGDTSPVVIVAAVLGVTMCIMAVLICSEVRSRKRNRNHGKFAR